MRLVKKDDDSREILLDIKCDYITQYDNNEGEKWLYVKHVTKGDKSIVW